MLEINDISDVFCLPYGDANTAYRGQTNIDWGLVPGIFRVPTGRENPSADVFLHRERHLVGKFFERAVPYFANLQRSEIADIIVAQHYGVPTRLLDWSYEPFVALYFAVSDRQESDAALFACKTMVALAGALTTRKITILPSQGSEFVIFTPPALDERIVSQKSCFTILKNTVRDGAFVPLEERVLPQSDIAVKAKIPSRRKRHLRWQLNNIGVNEAALFPGPAGIGGHIRKIAFHEL